MILFLTRIPPDPSGHGGSQRAMHLLRGLARLGPVDVMLIHREGDADSVNPMVEARKVARSCEALCLSDWTGPVQRKPQMSYRRALLAELLSGYCADAPRLSRATLRSLASALPQTRYDLVFAGRLPCAVVAGDMIRHRMIEVTKKVVDFDDIMSRFSQRQVEADRGRRGRFWRLVKTIDSRRVYRAEQRILRQWDAISVCSDDDVTVLSSREANANLACVPNVVDKPRLPATTSPISRLLFVGSLSHEPNVHGLRIFLEGSWPKIKSAVPGVVLRVVGMLPWDGIRNEVESVGGELYVDVPCVEPYYRDCDVVISPIFFGGGTRIKILEAMSYGRAVMSTSIGAEGLGLVPDIHAAIANDAEKMADACIRLCRNPSLRERLAEAAFHLQQERFSPPVLNEALGSMVVNIAGADRSAVAKAGR